MPRLHLIALPISRDPIRIAAAYLERDGSISVRPKASEPRVVDVRVADGVQIVRVQVV